MKKLGLRHHECVIVEDSDVGKRSATASGAFLCAVNGFDDVNYYKVLASIYEAEKINVVIPAAGQGKRFSEAGYLFPKPFIDVEGRPMIYHVLDNFKGVGHKYVLMQKAHIDKYSALDILRHHCSDLDILEVNGLTEGAACTVLLAKQYFDNNNELILANSDQYVDADIMVFVNDMRERDADAGILTFKSDDPKWSYAKIGFEGYVTEVVEKKVISDQATVGIYYYRHGREFVKYAEQMIHKNIRTNNEFYVCPIFNEFIADGKKICTYEIPEYNMYGLGTPEDLKEFVKNG